MTADDEQKLYEAIQSLVETVAVCHSTVSAIKAQVANYQRELAMLREQVADLLSKPAPTSKRKQRSYADWKKVYDLAQGGMSQKEIAAQWNLPVSTVSTYCRMTPDQAMTLPGALVGADASDGDL